MEQPPLPCCHHRQHLRMLGVAFTFADMCFCLGVKLGRVRCGVVVLFPREVVLLTWPMEIQMFPRELISFANLNPSHEWIPTAAFTRIPGASIARICASLGAPHANTYFEVRKLCLTCGTITLQMLVFGIHWIPRYYHFGFLNSHREVEYFDVSLYVVQYAVFAWQYILV